MKSYQELMKLESFADRLKYLSTASKVGDTTFGDNRYLNQLLYHDSEWKRARHLVISRDRGCDMALEDFPIFDRVFIHHINPITPEDILNRDRKVFDLENLISVSFNTHQLIHYGVQNPKLETPTVRAKGDTCPWK
jgi:hypothetical protein